MCGISGIYSPDAGFTVDRGLLGAMTEAIHHRGPDDSGLHVEPGLGLGHRRLSIIDLAGGHQPMYDPSERLVLVFNGQIYNFLDLRAELEARGATFRTSSDTEIIIEAYRAWGDECVTRFRGMFAFAIWDRDRGRLLLARDRLGIKPLFYAWMRDGSLAFASELKGLMVHPHLPREIDERAVEDYFALGYVPDPRTIYKGVYKLEPGHTLSLARGENAREPRRYWDVTFDVADPATDAGAEARHEEALREQMREAVKVRLMSEVPLGAFLSGGVDSSAVVATMAGLSDEPVKTCSIAFDDRDHDESGYARDVAERYSTNHDVRTLNPDDFELVDRLGELYDEPYADSSAMPTYRVCQLARERVTVALSGDGGDEVLAGYRRYAWHMREERVRGLLPLGVRKSLIGPIAAAYPKADWAPKPLRAKSTLESLARDAIEGYFHSVSLLPDALRARLFTRDFHGALDGHRAVDTFHTHADRVPTDDALSLVQYLDMKTYLPGDILTKVDRASMAHSLEVRVPLLDHEFIGWAGTVPSKLKLQGSDGKRIFKRAFKEMLPYDLMYRRKMGFAVPLTRWFRGPLRERMREAVLGGSLAATGMFEQRYLETMVDSHLSGRRDFTAPLWSLLMFDAFQRSASARADAATRREAA